MSNQVHDIGGILLQSSFSYSTPDGLPTFSCLKVLDKDYKPVGPDLIPLLAQCLIRVECQTSVGMVHSVMPIMSIICGETMKCQNPKVS